MLSKCRLKLVQFAKWWFEKLLKSWEMKDIKAFDNGRQYPATMIIKDNLKKNSNTTIKFKDMKFNVDFETEVFSQRWLKRR